MAADASRASVLCLPQRPARGAAGEPAAPAAAVLSLTLARMLSHLLDSTTSLAARLPLPLPHLLSPPHTPRHPRGRGVPAPAAGLAPAPVPPLPTDTPRTMYGLGVGEAESADEDQGEEAAADLTAGELRRLQASPAFQRHLRSKGLTIDDLAELASRLHLYRRLRRLDPAAFWLLVPPQSRLGVESRTPGAALLAGDYLLSTGVNLLVALALLACLTDAALPGAAKALVALLAWWLTGAAWVAGRTTAGRLSGECRCALGGGVLVWAALLSRIR